MGQLAEQVTETRGLIQELRDQLVPISEVMFKQAALERQHRRRIQDELQHLRQQLQEYQLRQDLLQTRMRSSTLQEEVGDLARTIFNEPAVSRVRPSSNTTFRRT